MATFHQPRGGQRKAMRMAGWPAVFLAAGAIVLASSRATAQTRRAVPTSGYFVSFRSYFDGDYREALRDFRSAARSGIRSTLGRWIDSICYHTMVGECHYQMGDLTSALEQYDAALKLFLNHRDWMLRVQFPPTVGPSTSRIRSTITWGVGPRRSSLGRFPDTMPSFQGRLDNELVLQQGGVVSAPKFYPIRVQEIVRCTALALRRRMELLGPACEHDPLSTQLMDALATRPAPINHWSRAWVNVQLGLALAGAGRTAEAVPELESSILVAGEFDHPLTATAQLELGKLALAQGQAEAAATFFLDATLSAAEFEQADLVEEAFRHGLVAHLAINNQDVYPPLVPAAVWARQNRFPQLYASLLIMAAENHASLGRTRQAAQLLDQARRAMGRRDMLAGSVGARYHYQLAYVNFQGGNMAAGDAALASAMEFQRRGSPRLFQIAITDQLYSTGTFTPRTADVVYGKVLREPMAADWIIDPMETLSVVVTPHVASLENWFQVAISRKSLDQAIQIADQIRRHRFYARLPFGGRLLALRWILEAPETALSEAARLQRQDLMVKYPKYAQLSKQAQAVRQELADLPLDAEDGVTRARQSELIDELSEISAQQELLLREIAVRRNPAEFVFPPLYSTKEIQQALAPGQLALVYLATGRSLHAFMLSRDNYAHWHVASPVRLSRQIATVLRAMGNLDNNKPVTAELLSDTRWQTSARLLLDQLIEKRQHGFWERFDQLTIVPDGLLWYYPFETLQVPVGDQNQPLASKIQIRYLPTASLVVPDQRGHRPLNNTAVVVGRLFPSDEPQVATAALEELQGTITDVAALRSPSPGPTGVYRSVWDRLVVLDEIEDYARGPLAWSPAQIDQGKPESGLARWLELPWGGPEQIVLPGFKTAAAGSLKRVPDGGDMFLSITTLMATGARTILISRWRTGGKTSFDLVHEYLRELPEVGAVQAWQQSVQRVRQTPLEPEREPRLSVSAGAAPMVADHPFFWSGYLLVDIAGRPPREE